MTSNNTPADVREAAAKIADEQIEYRRTWSAKDTAATIAAAIRAMPLSSHEPDGQQAEEAAADTRTVCERCGKAGLFFCDHVAAPQPTETIKRIEDGHANTEGEAVELFAHLNCPACGWSGHIDDAQPTERERIVAWLWEQSAKSGRFALIWTADAIERGEHLAGEGE